jgi:phytoene dehydrogenase-like protein
VAKAWPRNGFVIDGGVHYLMGHRPGLACHKLYQELGVLKGKHFPDLEDYVHFVDENTGHEVNFTPDLEKLVADLKKIAPEDSRLIDDFFAGVRSLQKTDIFNLMESPVELLGPFGLLKQMWHLRRSLRWMGGPYNKNIIEFSRSVQNASLRRMLTHLFLPEMPAWFMMFLIALLANRQMGFITAGCADFAESLVTRFKGLGGEIRFNSTVKEILVENCRAAGVRLENGEEMRADTVVSAGDGYSTIFKLLGGKYLDAKLKSRYENWQRIRPLMTISFGVNREFKTEPALNFLLFKDTMRVGNEVIDGFPLRFFNYSDKFAPAGKTVVQVLLITDWKFWNELRDDRARYDAAKNAICTEVLTRLEKHYPGITAQVELTDIATPYTTWRYTLNHEGAFMGWSPTPKALRTPFKKTLPGLGNFYMAGQWVMPGGGVPPCFYSGRHVVQLMCRRDGKIFQTSTV